VDRGAKHWEAEAEKRKELESQAQGRWKWEGGRYRKLGKGEVTWDIFHFRPQNFHRFYNSLLVKY